MEDAQKSQETKLEKEISQTEKNLTKTESTDTK